MSDQTLPARLTELSVMELPMLPSPLVLRNNTGKVLEGEWLIVKGGWRMQDTFIPFDQLQNWEIVTEGE